MIVKVHITLLIAILYNLYITKKDIFFIAYLFIIMHEISHMIMALLLRVDVDEIVLLPFGVTAKYKGKITLLQELLIAMVGPLASVCLAFVYHNATYFAINIVIAIFNMIPIYPLDGGRILKVFSYGLFGEKKGRIVNERINHFSVGVLLFMALLFVWNYQRFELLLISLFVLKLYKEEMKKEKILSAFTYLQMDE